MHLCTTYWIYLWATDNNYIENGIDRLTLTCTHREESTLNEPEKIEANSSRDTQEMKCFALLYRLESVVVDYFSNSFAFLLLLLLLLSPCAIAIAVRLLLFGFSVHFFNFRHISHFCFAFCHLYPSQSFVFVIFSLLLLFASTYIEYTKGNIEQCSSSFINAEYTYACKVWI